MLVQGCRVVVADARDRREGRGSPVKVVWKKSSTFRSFGAYAPVRPPRRLKLSERRMEAEKDSSRWASEG